jgi:hypothetical protein
MAKGSTFYGSSLYNMLQYPPAPPDSDDPYFAALGKFIASNASAEHTVHSTARRPSHPTEAKARIIFSGMRLGDLVERIRGLLRATKVSDKKYNEIDACLVQLEAISEQRNKLIAG